MVSLYILQKNRIKSMETTANRNYSHSPLTREGGGVRTKQQSNDKGTGRKVRGGEERECRKKEGVGGEINSGMEMGKRGE